jgi:hypothetical protein
VPNDAACRLHERQHPRRLTPGILGHVEPALQFVELPDGIAKGTRRGIHEIDTASASTMVMSRPHAQTASALMTMTPNADGAERESLSNDRDRFLLSDRNSPSPLSTFKCSDHQCLS